MTMLEDMQALIEEAHAGQTDKAGKPYVDHPRRVMANLPPRADEELKCIALGHDLIEDTFVTAEILRERGFTDRVIDGISKLTKKKGQRYEEYQAEVLSSVDTMLVKDADLKDNSDLSRLSHVTDRDLARTRKYADFRKKIQQERSKSAYVNSPEAPVGRI